MAEPFNYRIKMYLQYVTQIGGEKKICRQGEEKQLDFYISLITLTSRTY